MQNFTIPGYSIVINTQNLAGGSVQQIQVQALDQASNTMYTNTSATDGTAGFNLEKGTVVLDGYWNNVSVGESTVSITGDASLNFNCKLTTIKVSVENKDGISISLVNLEITYQYTTTLGNTVQTGNYSGQTDTSGVFSLNFALPGIDYSVNASLYGVVFNSGNNTISSLPAAPTYQATIICPSETLTLTTVDSSGAALPNARMEFFEQTSGVFYGAMTDNTGKVSTELTFGQYKVRVYAGNILLNETSINVFSNSQSEIHCNLYNLQVTVKTVDYFGNPIPNVNVILSQPGTETRSGTTKADGTVTFDNMIGGNIQLTAYSPGKENSYVTTSISAEAPTYVPIKLGEFVALGPFLIETTLFATFLLILVAVVVLLLAEIYYRKVRKPRKS